jgi:adenine-specific DNA-methyltransferase
VDLNDLERHDKWLCMMWPRLSLLHELLHDEGIFFCSIDDNEMHDLRALLDDLFGERNFLGQVSVLVNPK